jgi:hypothetical protein
MGARGRLMDSPHYAQIKFTIDVFPVLPDGSLDPNRLTQAELNKLGITNTAVFGVEGYNKENCISKLKQVLGGLKYEETR